MRVLIVDDEPSFVAILEALLLEQYHEVISANSAEEAIEILKRVKFDIMISDIKMPGLSGWDLIDHTSIYKNMFVVAITGFEPIVPEANLGVTLLKKPVTREDVSKIIRLAENKLKA